MILSSSLTNPSTQSQCLQTETNLLCQQGIIKSIYLIIDIYHAISVPNNSLWALCIIISFLGSYLISFEGISKMTGDISLWDWTISFTNFSLASCVSKITPTFGSAMNRFNVFSTTSWVVSLLREMYFRQRLNSLFILLHFFRRYLPVRILWLCLNHR